MKYLFECKNKHTYEIELPMGQVGKVEVTCPICNEKMNRKYDSQIVVPDYMQAGEESDVMDWVKDRMTHRISGKDKVLY